MADVVKVFLEGLPGPQGLVWRGVWSAATSYAVRDAVSYQGVLYYATTTSLNDDPTASPTPWEVLLDGPELLAGPVELYDIEDADLNVSNEYQVTDAVWGKIGNFKTTVSAKVIFSPALSKGFHWGWIDSADERLTFEGGASALSPAGTGATVVNGYGLTTSVAEGASGAVLVKENSDGDSAVVQLSGELAP